MYPVKLSLLILVAVALLIPAPPAAADDDFVFIYFPHEDIESRFSDDWGDARSGGRRHQGNDIFGAKHSPVVAVADGFVTAIGTSNRAGNYIRLTRSSRATATRDLQDLVAKGALTRTGERRNARYHLNLN